MSSCQPSKPVRLVWWWRHVVRVSVLQIVKQIICITFFWIFFRMLARIAMDLLEPYGKLGKGWACYLISSCSWDQAITSNKYWRPSTDLDGLSITAAILEWMWCDPCLWPIEMTGDLTYMDLWLKPCDNTIIVACHLIGPRHHFNQVVLEALHRSRRRALNHTAADQ